MIVVDETGIEKIATFFDKIMFTLIKHSQACISMISRVVTQIKTIFHLQMSSKLKTCTMQHVLFEYTMELRMY